MIKDLFLKIGGFVVSIPVIPRQVKNLIMWPIATRILRSQHKKEVLMKDGFKMYGSMQDILSREILFKGPFKKRIWEPSTSIILERLSKEASEILIAGAHMGYLVLLAALSTRGRVHAFEPIPYLFNRSKENFSLNPELEKKIVLSQSALGESDGSVTMYSEDIRSSVIPYSGGHVAHQNKVEVPITTIDSYAIEKNIEKIDLILLDIEGFEWFALNGAESNVLKKRPKLILEISPKVLRHTAITPQMMFDRLINMNYSISFIDDNSEGGRLVEYDIESAKDFLSREYVNILAIPL